MFHLFEELILLEHQRVVSQLCLVDLFTSTNPCLANARIEWRRIENDAVIVITFFYECGKFFMILGNVIMKYFPCDAQPLIFLGEKDFVERGDKLQ